MDKKKQLRDALSKLSKMTPNTPYDKLYKELDDIVNSIEAFAKEESAKLFQKLVDIIKPKETPVAETVTNPVEEVKKDDQPQS